MKANVQKFIGMAVLGLALLSISIPAWAGMKSLREVIISDRQASGTMAGARYSADSQQYIGCYILGNSDFITCSARDKTGKSFACYGDSKWKAVVKAITDFSQIYFFTSAPTDAACSYLEIQNDSLYFR